ncbi:hypothetical protein [Rhodococcus sp. IEGM1428]|uniref:hypothetical protein n=1 Tax=Rhodococcus sp. IEGM1428 TaxID=3392191 RepID=UPI003D09DF12
MTTPKPHSDKPRHGRARARLSVKVIAAVLIAAYAAFGLLYRSPLWIYDAPTTLPFDGRTYIKSHRATLLELPEGESISIHGHFIPLMFGIYGRDGFETNSSVYVRWWDDHYIEYSLSGSP